MAAVAERTRLRSGTTCSRRLRDWQEAAVWQWLYETLFNWPSDEVALDWSRASLDNLSVRAKRGGEQTGPNPVNRGKPGSKDPLVVDRKGISLAVRHSAVTAHDSTSRLPMVDGIPPVISPRGKPGRPRKRPAKLHADQAYESTGLRRALPCLVAPAPVTAQGARVQPCGAIIPLALELLAKQL